MGLISKIFGDANEKYVRNLKPVIDKINSLEADYKSLSDDDLRAKTASWQAEFKAMEDKDDADKLKAARLDEILPEAFAVMREASLRVNKMRHFDVQLIGGIVLHKGKIAEMKTGEGKTLVATLPLYLNALSGDSVQLITVNDYLSQVGAGWMAPVYHFLGLTTAVIIHDQALKYDPDHNDENQFDERLRHFRVVNRREAYLCDILYGTNNEFGFDYLRDNMAPGLERQVQRPLNFAIVDEIDSILIDEARTPLIISAPASDSSDKYGKFAELVQRLKENEDYNVDEKMRAATLTEEGISKMEKWLGVDNIYTSGGIREVHHIEQALKARTLFLRDRDYVVKEGEVIIVDEFTGRMMHGRRYSEGLHQAIEAKEGVKVQQESQTYATVTFQNYFRMYKKLAGMTGTAATEAEEFAKIYNLETIVIPTNKPNVRKDGNDLIYKTEEAKFLAVIEEVKRRNALGQPLLIGTISIEKNERLALMMEREGLHPQVLNAKNHGKEAQFIAQAGRLGAITIATNMAGRGVDIILGGNPPVEGEQEKVIAAGGLHVIGTERHESRRIDNQLRGRAGRQGDPGSSQFFVSMEDDLMRIFGGDRMKSLMNTLKVPDDMPIENKIVSRSIESAQKKVEGNNFDIRKHLVDFDDVINKHREAIYRRRQEVLTEYDRNKDKAGNGKELTALSGKILEMVELEIENVISFHTAADDIDKWDMPEIQQVMNTIFPVGEAFGDEVAGLTKDAHKLDRVKVRTQIIEKLAGMAREKYEAILEASRAAGMDWLATEKAILLRSIDTLWVEHLEAMSLTRQGIGLRGYGQRDPLIEYKKEAFRHYHELNAYIQKEVVYSVYKIGAMHFGSKQAAADIDRPVFDEATVTFSAPAKTMDKGSSQETRFASDKAKNPDGSKVGRNDLCPCGSGKKYKKCHGA